MKFKKPTFSGRLFIWNRDEWRYVPDDSAKLMACITGLLTEDIVEEQDEPVIIKEH
jgi:hypothetical protein